MCLLEEYHQTNPDNILLIFLIQTNRFMQLFNQNLNLSPKQLQLWEGWGQRCWSTEQSLPPVRPETCCLCVIYYQCVLDSIPRRHMTLIQRRFNLDETSWRCIDAEPTLYKRHVPAGIVVILFISSYLNWWLYHYLHAWIGKTYWKFCYLPSQGNSHVLSFFYPVFVKLAIGVHSVSISTWIALSC